MQNSERDQFEHSWKAAFDGAEMTPSDRLWNSIELELSGNDTAVMKRRVVFYQRLAAATVLFALLSGAYAVYTYKSGSNEVASTQTQQPATTRQPEVNQPPQTDQQQPQQNGVDNALASADANKSTDRVRSSAKDSQVQEGKTHFSTTKVTNSPPAPVVLNEDERLSDSNPLPLLPLKSDETALTQTEKQEPVNSDLDKEVRTADEARVATLLSADEINALAEAEAKKEDDKNKAARSLWLGLGGAAGSYAPSTVVTNGALMSSADYASNPSSLASSQGIPQSYGETVGSAYSAGVSAGWRFAKRWVLQSGINYINQQVDYTTNFVGVSSSNKAMAMTQDYVADTQYNVMVTNPYEVSSATEILSIPAQIGFLIIDRKFGWQLNTGVSTDMLLRSTLTDKSGARAKVSEGSGEDSPYRTFNGAALLNTEVSYKIGNHYRLAIVPGMRYSFKPMLKEHKEGTPLILDIGFRFKYLFN